ncbi:hypothetical protein BDZ91DRAFT_770890 [Kalaharituber pfeilii]|nr:hypothetical protein BDZ91DRAFT_770890 [Kalaharituber pfeilii]
MAPPTQIFSQDTALTRSLSDPSQFWAPEAEKLTWTRPPSSILETNPSETGGRKWKWFSGGQISTTYNCITRHVNAGYGDQPAIIWDSPVTDTYNHRITYAQLLRDVQVLAGVLRGLGVVKGSRVLIYMPMIPPAVAAMYATAHLGAVHSVVFGGFAPAECAKRIASCEPEVILTATCGIEGGTGGKRRVIPYLPLVREAVKLSGLKKKSKIPTILVWQREQYVESLEDQEIDWKSITRQVEKRWNDDENNSSKTEQGIIGYEQEGKEVVRAQIATGAEAEWAPVVDGVPVDSSDPLYIIYTSGTTGLPKGVVREAGGHAVGLNMQIGYLFGIKPGDVMFTASDIGWVVGHSYIVYAPLLARATTILFEGKPVGTPSADTFWRIVQDYQVNVLFTAPTALRAIRREDPTGDLFFKKRNLRSLRGLFLAGERSEAAVVEQYQKFLTEYCAPDARVVDNWWSTESGSPMTGIALGVQGARIPIKPGSAGKPMPGWDIRAVDDEGREVKRGEMGNIVLGMPLAPTGFRTLWQDDRRFITGYLDRFHGVWLDTGDAGLVDDEGFVHIMSRTDDVINVAAHRFSTGGIEQAIASHPLVAECCVVGMPDSLKGHIPFALIHLNSASSPPPPDVLFTEINTLFGGVASGHRIIPKTRSGKTLRRVVRELVENAVKGNWDQDVAIPPTVEDAEVIKRSKMAIKEYFFGRREKARL